MGGVAGRIMPLPRGDYTSITVYNILDMVRYDNCLWIAKKNQIVDVTPSKENEEYWMQATELSDVDVIKNSVAEMKDTVTGVQNDVNALDLRIGSLENQSSTGTNGVPVVIGDTEPEAFNTFWFNTSTT